MRAFSGKLQLQQQSEQLNEETIEGEQRSLSKQEHAENGSGQVEQNKVLAFIQKRSNLKQIYSRSTNDGMFPIIQCPTEYTIKDVQNLVKNDKTDPFPFIIENLSKQTQTSNPIFLTKFLSMIYDRESDLVEKMFFKMKEQDLAISPVMYNYFLLNGVTFNNHKFMMQVLSEMTLIGVSVDLNVYLKLFSCMYFDADIRFDRKEFLVYLYQLFAKDHSKDVFDFGTELFQEYLDSNMTALNSIKEKSKKKGKKSQKQEEGQEKPSPQPYHHGQSHKRSYQEPSEIDAEQLAEDLKLDQLNDLFQNRNNLYRSQMHKSKNNLKRQNLKKQSFQTQTQANKHLQKYQQLQNQIDQDQDGQGFNGNNSQLVVELGSLKDFDGNPQNIKELSKVMAQQIESLLKEDLGKMSGNEGRQKIAHYKFDVLPFTTNNKKNQHQQKPKQKITDERFSLDSFYGKEHEEAATSHISDRYNTTQEENTTESMGQTQRSQLAQSSQAQSLENKNNDQEEKEDQIRKNIIRDELKENEKTKIIKDDTTTDEKSGPKAGGSRQ